MLAGEWQQKWTWGLDRCLSHRVACQGLVFLSLRPPPPGDLGLKAGIWKDGQLSSQACACLADKLPLVAGSCGSLPESPPFLTLPLYPKVTLEEDNPQLPAPSTSELQAPRSGSSLSWMNLLVERPAWEGTQGLVSGAKARDDWGGGSPCFGEHIALGTGKP